MAIKRNWLGVVELWSAGWMKLAQQAPRSITPLLHFSRGKHTATAHVLANSAIGSLTNSIEMSIAKLQQQAHPDSRSCGWMWWGGLAVSFWRPGAAVRSRDTVSRYTPYTASSPGVAVGLHPPTSRQAPFFSSEREFRYSPIHPHLLSKPSSRCYPARDYCVRIRNRSVSVMPGRHKRETAQWRICCFKEMTHED